MRPISAISRCCKRRRWWRWALRWGRNCCRTLPTFSSIRASASPSAHVNSRLAILLALIWLPLTAYVMFRSELGALGSYLLLPAIPSVIALYVLALRSWRESWVAMLGATLVCFWLLMA